MTVLGILNTLCLTIGLIANLLAISGGGLVIPPFKSLYWLQTPNTLVGVYGGCPRTSAEGFFTIDSDWRDIQSSCWQFFKVEESAIDGTCKNYSLTI